MERETCERGRGSRTGEACRRSAVRAVGTSLLAAEEGVESLREAFTLVARHAHRAGDEGRRLEHGPLRGIRQVVVVCPAYHPLLRSP